MSHSIDDHLDIPPVSELPPPARSSLVPAPFPSLPSPRPPLTRAAQKLQSLILLTRHLNKKAGSRSLSRGGGSIGLIAQCRSGWLVGLEPREQKANLLAAADSPQGKRCVLAQLKNNNAPLQPSLRYEIIAHASGYPTIRCLGTCSVSAGDLVPQPPPTTLGPRLRACQFLKDFLPH